MLYVGISDTPAWQVARMQAIADLRGWSPLVALQIEYSLIERTVERELIPMARELGLGVLPWSPLGSGVLTGKYTRADLEAGDGVPDPTGTRRNVAAAAGSLTERSLAIADVVGEVAAETGALAGPGGAGVDAPRSRRSPPPILGARTLDQLEDNLGALDVTFTAEQRARLDEASAVELGFPHDMLRSDMPRGLMFGGTTIEPRR